MDYQVFLETLYKSSSVLFAASYGDINASGKQSNNPTTFEKALTKVTSDFDTIVVLDKVAISDINVSYLVLPNLKRIYAPLSSIGHIVVSETEIDITALTVKSVLINGGTLNLTTKSSWGITLQGDSCFL